MAHNDRMRPIADPYLTQRLRAIYRQAYDVRNEGGPRTVAQNTRNVMDMKQSNAPGLEGRSEMHEDYDPEEGTGGYSDLGALDVSVNPAVRAYQESGHGVRVFEGHPGQ